MKLNNTDHSKENKMVKKKKKKMNKRHISQIQEAKQTDPSD